MLHTDLIALSSIEPELRAIEVCMAGIGISDLVDSCDLDLNPMTFIANLTRIAWRYTGCANMNFLRHIFRKLSSDRHIDRQTSYVWSLLVT